MKRLTLIMALCQACVFGAKAQDTLVVVMADDTKEYYFADDLCKISHHEGDTPEEDYLFFYNNSYKTTKVMAKDVKEVQFRDEVVPVVEGAVQATCADVIAGEDETIFQVTGQCTSVKNTYYGNWYLSDGENEIYIYGTVDKNGNYLADFDIKEGDIVTVCGSKETYFTTVELVNVQVLSHRKNPLVVTGTNYDGNVPQMGGEVIIYFTIGNAQKYSVEFADDWLQRTGTGFSSGQFSVKAVAAPNDGKMRDTQFIVSAEGAKCSFKTKYTITQDGVALTSGTIDNPMTVEEAIEAAAAGYTDAFYIKGIVSKLSNGGFSATYHNGSFYISSDGIYHDDQSLDFLCYQVNYIDNELWYEDQHPQIKEGDEVVIYGPLTVYKGTSETQGKGKAYIVSLVPAEEQGGE